MSEVMKPYNAGDDPGYTGEFESDQRQCDRRMATAWAVHVNFPQKHTDTVLDLLNEMLDLQEKGERSYGLIGRYLDEGDSWEEWGEPSKGDDDRHFVVYFRTEAPGATDTAWRNGSHIATHIHMRVARAAEDTFNLNLDFAISTAGDFAEQISGE